MTPSTNSAPSSLDEAELQWRRAHSDELVEEVLRLRARDAAAVYVRLRMREIADLVKAWDVCDRPACRRSCSCRRADVPCFDEHAGELRLRLQELAEWSRFDGPFDDAVLDEIAAGMRERGAPI